MVIGGFYAIPSTPVVFNPVLVARPSSHVSSSAIAVEPAPRMTSIADQPKLPSKSADAPSSAGRPVVTGNQASAAASSAQQETQVTSYSTSVAGLQYWG